MHILGCSKDKRMMYKALNPPCSPVLLCWPLLQLPLTCAPIQSSMNDQIRMCRSAGASVCAPHPHRASFALADPYLPPHLTKTTSNLWTFTALVATLPALASLVKISLSYSLMLLSQSSFPPYPVVPSFHCRPYIASTLLLCCACYTNWFCSLCRRCVYWRWHHGRHWSHR